MTARAIAPQVAVPPVILRFHASDLQTEHERYLTEQVFKKPVFVTDYPKEIKAF
mgnify:CR=1 FL=1